MAQQWTLREGLPSNTVRNIFVASDGYFWLSTNEGLARFDGYHFTVYNAANTPALPSNRIVNVQEGPVGSLWILTEQGDVGSYHEGTFTRFEVEAYVRGRFMYPDADTAWFATTSGVARYVDGHMQPYRPDVIDTAIRLFRRDTASLAVGLL